MAHRIDPQRIADSRTAKTAVTAVVTRLQAIENQVGNFTLTTASAAIKDMARYLRHIIKLVTCLAFLLLAEPVSAASVDIWWQHDAFPTNLGYKIYWSNYSGNSKVFPFKRYTTIGNTKSVKINGLNDTEKYYFRVTAYDALGESPYSNYISLFFIRKPTELKFQRIEIR
jgi:hypothetical protein